MLSDRSYMRDDYPQGRTSVLTWLMCGIVAGFVLQYVFGSAWLGGGVSLAHQFALTIPGLKAGYFWTLVTHSFLHDKEYLFHVIGNLLGLYFLGRALLPLLGSKRFLGLYFGATLVGGLAWTLVHWRFGGMLLGATAAVDALLVVFACFYPNQRIEFLLFFILPVSIKPKHLALAIAALDLFGLLIYEIPGSSLPFGLAVANSAHLGGLLTGWIYFRYLHEIRWRLPSSRADVEMPRWMKKKGNVAAPEPAYRVNLSNRNDLRVEVDRILDKINSSGFGALTAAEKRVLDEAKDSLSRR
jgi:membrane associated rhomboid family serine protease